MDVSTDNTLEIRDSDGKLCGIYHYDDFFKPFFRGLYTPNGKDVVAPPPPDHPHHKGLQFGLCTSDVNFWEESEDAEPKPPPPRPAIGRQQGSKPVLLPPADGIGFTQQVQWRTDTVCSFNETRKISVQKISGAYVWTWHTTLIAARDVKIIKSVWSQQPGQIGYCGLGLRLAQPLFEGGTISPPEMHSGSIPASVTFQGKGVEVKFEQDVKQANALFVSFYGGDPDFAFMALGPTNLQPRSLKAGERLDGTYVVTVADR
jgi:hypothetical protein